MNCTDFKIRKLLLFLKNKKKITDTIILSTIVVSAFLFITNISLRYINQPLTDNFTFRQTQTALTSFWILKEGWSFAYQTPVAGYPWSIPFEFPVYQTIVSMVVMLTDLDLSAVGRFISFLFLIACIWPAFAISRRLNLPNSVPLIFCALLWTSPIYVYWARTFMIETLALFFALFSIPYALDCASNKCNLKSILFFWFFSIVAILQKITTEAPILLFLFLFFFFNQINQKGFNLKVFKTIIKFALIIIMPLLIGFIWTFYTDIIKSVNPFGIQLTSNALTTWNFGTFKQRIDPNTWKILIWDRSLSENAGGFAGLLLLGLPYMIRLKIHKSIKYFSLCAIFLFLLPLFVFTNLHLVHQYYQVSNIVFLLGALAIIIGAGLNKLDNARLILPLVTILIIASNLTQFNSNYGYGKVVAREFASDDVKQSYQIGQYLREVTKEDTAIVVFGKDWSSEVSFYAQRKSITAPPWFREYKKLWERPQDYLGGMKLAAIVICRANVLEKNFPNLEDINSRIQKESNWIYKNIYGCDILLSNNEMKMQH
jgi:hypothetical protein